MPSLNTRKTNPTGGWWWHARAWRSQTDWQGVAQSLRDEWLRRDVHTVYWFDNVLGQLRFLQPLESTRHQINQLKKRLKGVAWGSLHDRYSGPLSGSHETPPDWRSTAGVDLHDPLAQPWLHRWGAKGDWLEMGWQLP
ncbi:MAG: hypothetical protein QM527_14005 [Alphaproteobacteria bacterium]|nr:hypothetical protein [Alphaproteobacteria bacterium]